jgi:hypothetical protein
LETTLPLSLSVKTQAVPKVIKSTSVLLINSEANEIRSFIFERHSSLLTSEKELLYAKLCHNDLYSKISYNFNGFLHLCGSKNYDKFLYLIRSKILFEFKGYNYINKLNELYPEILSFEQTPEHYDNMKKILAKKRNIL